MKGKKKASKGLDELQHVSDANLHQKKVRWLRTQKGVFGTRIVSSIEFWAPKYVLRILHIKKVTSSNDLNISKHIQSK